LVVVRNNMIVSGGEGQIAFSLHSVIAGPCFKDMAARDFTLRPESPAFAPGFRPIDLSDVGPRPKERRTG
jgi:hypothetical protein